jgi:pilus assembly protein Flp/PilA
LFNKAIYQAVRWVLIFPRQFLLLLGRSSERSLSPKRRQSTMPTKSFNHLRELHGDESGQDLIEYALVAAMIALGAATTLGTLATSINSVFTKMNSSLTSAAS